MLHRLDGRGRRLAAALWVVAALVRVSPVAAQTRVTTVLGTGVAGYSDVLVNNPYGMTWGPDGALYFCDLDNQRVRRLDVRTHQVTTVAGTGGKGYTGDGGPATAATLQKSKPSAKFCTVAMYLCDMTSATMEKQATAEVASAGYRT